MPLTTIISLTGSIVNDGLSSKILPNNQDLPLREGQQPLTFDVTSPLLLAQQIDDLGLYNQNFESLTGGAVVPETGRWFLALDVKGSAVRPGDFPQQHPNFYYRLLIVLSYGSNQLQFLATDWRPPMRVGDDTVWLFSRSVSLILDLEAGQTIKVSALLERREGTTPPGPYIFLVQGDSRLSLQQMANSTTDDQVNTSLVSLGVDLTAYCRQCKK